jgi:hypothetical protein
LSSFNSSSTAAASDTGSFISITPINKKAKDYMDMRDDAMEYQCKGELELLAQHLELQCIGCKCAVADVNLPGWLCVQHTCGHCRPASE